MAELIDIASMNAMLVQQMDALIDALRLVGERRGREFVAYNPTRADAHLGSFVITTVGGRAGIWCDFATSNPRTGKPHGGDPIALIAYIPITECDGDMGKAVRWARRFLGLDGGELSAVSRRRLADADAAAVRREASAKSEAVERRSHAWRLWLGARESLRDTPAAAYLAGRGIDLARLGRQPKALRYHSQCHNTESGKAWPALLAAITDRQGRHISTHRIWLAYLDPSTGSRHANPTGLGNDYQVVKAPLKNPKKALGLYFGGTIRLWQGAGRVPLNKAGAGETVALTEGIEDGLTVALARPDLRVMAAVGLSNMANIELPDEVMTVMICADNDRPGSDAAKALHRAQERFLGEGRRVLIARPPAGVKDMNELLVGPAAAGDRPSAQAK